MADPRRPGAGSTGQGPAVPEAAVRGGPVPDAAIRGAAGPGGAGGRRAPGWVRPDSRRRLQLAVAALWLLDAALQFQPFMFGQGFARMLAPGAAGNPAAVAAPIAWATALIGQQPVVANAAFASVQVLLGLGIAWRPTVRIALSASVAWSLAVWWAGEGLGGVLTGRANPLAGAPGAVLIYALLAALLWPSDRARRGAEPAGAGQPGAAGTFAAGRAAGPAAARSVWLVLWGGLAWLSVADAHAAPLAAAASAPGSVLLAALFGLIAAGIWLPPPGARAAVLLAVATGLGMWAVGQDFGGILSGTATDPDTGPLLALLALAYWPSRRPGRPPLSGPTRLPLSRPARPPFSRPARPPRSGPARAGRDAVAMQGVMGLAMAGMLLPRLDPVPLPVWRAAAAAGLAWFGWRCLRESATARRTGGPGGGHHLPHVLGCAAMLYMTAMAGTAAGSGPVGGMGSRGIAGAPAFLLAAALAGSAVWITDRLPVLSPVRSRATGAATSPATLPGASPATLPATSPATLPGASPGRLAACAASSPGRPSGWLPCLAAWCQIAMGIAMGCLLIQML